MMGSDNNKIPQHEKYEKLSSRFIQEYFAKRMKKVFPEDLFNTFSIIKKDDKDRAQLYETFKMMKESKNFDTSYLPIDFQAKRCIASLLGLAICDALGASTQFLPFLKTGHGLIEYDFQDVIKGIKNGDLDARAGKVGIWTDDCSMSLCMADSLLINNWKFNGKHIRYLFILWFFHGLNNGGRRYSIGLGGNIKISLDQFFKKQTDYCDQTDRFNNGNGSLMRLAPIPIAFRKNMKLAVDYSAKSSLTTHNGQEAEECCKLLAMILVNLINREEKANGRDVILKTCQSFKSPCKSVEFLAQSKQQSEEHYSLLGKKYGKKFLYFNQTIYDRNWNWMSQDYTYSMTRHEDKPGYVGSYCMDALAMALHTVWHTKSFKEVALVNANMGGDCDTVGAIAGQIAGALYGIEDYMMELYSQMEDFKSERYEVFLKGLKLAKKQ